MFRVHSASQSSRIGLSRPPQDPVRGTESATSESGKARIRQSLEKDPSSGLLGQGSFGSSLQKNDKCQSWQAPYEVTCLKPHHFVGRH